MHAPRSSHFVRLPTKRADVVMRAARIQKNQFRTVDMMIRDALAAQDKKRCTCAVRLRDNIPAAANLAEEFEQRREAAQTLQYYSSTEHQYFDQLTSEQQHYVNRTVQAAEYNTETGLGLYNKTEFCACLWEPAMVQKLARAEEARSHAETELNLVQERLAELQRQPTSQLKLSVEAHASVKRHERRGLLIFTLVPFRSGASQLSFVIRDDGGAENGGQNEANVSLAILVHPVNDRPHFELPSELVLVEDAGFLTMRRFAQTLRPGSADEMWQTLTFDVEVQGARDLPQSARSLQNAEKYSLLFATQACQQAPQCSLKDGGYCIGRTESGPFSLQGKWLTMSQAQLEPSLAAVHLTGTEKDACGGVLPHVDQDGVLRLRTARDQHGEVRLSVTARDDGGTAFGGRDVFGPVEMRLRVLPQPRVFAVVPRFGRVAGANLVTLHGQFFGIREDAPSPETHPNATSSTPSRLSRRVSLGGIECLRTTLISDSEIICVAPPGIGGGAAMVELLSDDMTRLSAAPVKVAEDDGLHWDAIPAERAWGTGPSFSSFTSVSPPTVSAEGVPCPKPRANETCSLRSVTRQNPVSKTDEAYSLTVPTLGRGDAVMYRLRRAGALPAELAYNHIVLILGGVLVPQDATHHASGFVAVSPSPVFPGTPSAPAASAQHTDLYLSRGVSALAVISGHMYVGGSFSDAHRKHGGGIDGASWNSQQSEFRKSPGQNKVSVGSILSFDGHQVSALGLGVDGEVLALVSFQVLPPSAFHTHHTLGILSVCQKPCMLNHSTGPANRACSLPGVPSPLCTPMQRSAMDLQLYTPDPLPSGAQSTVNGPSCQVLRPRSHPSDLVNFRGVPCLNDLFDSVSPRCSILTLLNYSSLCTSSVHCLMYRAASEWAARSSAFFCVWQHYAVRGRSAEDGPAS